LGERADKPLSGLAPRHIESFITARTKAGLAPATVSLHGKVLRTALNSARRQGLLSTNPCEAVDLPKENSIERGTFGPEEVKMLVDSAEDEWKTVVLLAYFTGARLRPERGHRHVHSAEDP
jgi:site-specific recombinase XerC